MYIITNLKRFKQHWTQCIIWCNSKTDISVKTDQRTGHAMISYRLHTRSFKISSVLCDLERPQGIYLVFLYSYFFHKISSENVQSILSLCRPQVPLLNCCEWDCLNISRQDSLLWRAITATQIQYIYLCTKVMSMTAGYEQVFIILKISSTDCAGKETTIHLPITTIMIWISEQIIYSLVWWIRLTA